MALFDQLMAAIRRNNNGKVSELLGRLDVETVNGTGSHGCSPLHKACSLNNSHAVAALLAMDGIQLNGTAGNGWSPLHLACLNNNNHVVAALLAMDGLHVNTRDNDGHTPIMLAALYSNVEALRLMVGDPRVDIHVKDGNGQGLEEMAGRGATSQERNNTCIEILREERRKRENPGMRQNANAGDIEAAFKIQYQDQINEVNLELEESKKRQKENNEMRKKKMTNLLEKQQLEKKTLNIKSDQEIIKLENKKSELEKQMAILQQNLDQERQIKKTKEEKLKKKHDNEKTTLEKKFESEIKEDEENLTNLEAISSELSKNMRELDKKPENDAATNLEAARETLECPVCLETMKPPTRIWMCPASHLVCEPCQQRLEGRRCPTCMAAEVTLRAFFAEKLSRTVFNE